MILLSNGPTGINKYKGKLYLRTGQQGTAWFFAKQNKFTADTRQTLAVGIKENSLSKNIKVYPNPNKERNQVQVNYQYNYYI